MHRNESAYVMDSAAYAKTYLKLGYTTIRDAGNDYYASVTVPTKAYWQSAALVFLL